MSETDKLNKMLAEHYELQALFERDVNVHAWFSMVYAGKCTLEEAMIGLVIVAVKEKRAYFDKIVKMKQLTVERNQVK